MRNLIDVDPAQLDNLFHGIHLIPTVLDGKIVCVAIVQGNTTLEISKPVEYSAHLKAHLIEYGVFEERYYIKHDGLYEFQTFSDEYEAKEVLRKIAEPLGLRNASVEKKRVKISD